MTSVSILSFLPSRLHLSPSCPRVCTYVSVTEPLLRLQCAYHMIDGAVEHRCYYTSAPPAMWVNL